MLALFKILRVVLVGIGFPLEGYVSVTLDISAELYYPDEPFDQVNYVEKQITEFLDLCRVNHLVVYHHPVTRPLGKQHPEKVYRIKPFPERYYLVVDYFHKVATLAAISLAQVSQRWDFVSSFGLFPFASFIMHSSLSALQWFWLKNPWVNS